MSTLTLAVPYLIAVLADQLKVGKHLMEGEEPAVDRRDTFCPHIWETERRVVSFIASMNTVGIMCG
jgi:hypothetical protein